jgi:hypothetical protein
VGRNLARTASEHTLRVKDRVSGGKPYGIGLRLSAQAAQELSAPGKIDEFQRWLDAHNCYVFTINGFPYGSFHGTRVKEQVFRPDWTTPERLAYTNLLFDHPRQASAARRERQRQHPARLAQDLPHRGGPELQAIFTNLPPLPRAHRKGQRSQRSRPPPRLGTRAARPVRDQRRDPQVLRPLLSIKTRATATSSSSSA